MTALPPKKALPDVRGGLGVLPEAQPPDPQLTPTGGPEMLPA